MPYKTGIKAHDDAVLAAENVRQSAIVPGATQAQCHTADVTFARSAFASCRTNNAYSGSSQFSDMLRELGFPNG
jgi:hypothetical protein